MNQCNIKTVICIPGTPNYLRTENGDVIPVSAVSTSDLKKIGKAWTVSLIEKANQRKLEQSKHG